MPYSYFGSIQMSQRKTLPPSSGMNMEVTHFSETSLYKQNMINYKEEELRRLLP